MNNNKPGLYFDDERIISVIITCDDGVFTIKDTDDRVQMNYKINVLIKTVASYLMLQIDEYITERRLAKTSLMPYHMIKHIELIYDEN